MTYVQNYLSRINGSATPSNTMTLHYSSPIKVGMGPMHECSGRVRETTGLSAET